MSKSDVLREIAEDQQALWEVARAAIEDELIEWCDSRMFVLRNNGFVIKEKDGEESSIIRFGPEVGVSGGNVTIGKGVVTGIQLEAVLRRLSKVKGYHRFDDLPIPYRAVATDLDFEAVARASGREPKILGSRCFLSGSGSFDGWRRIFRRFGHDLTFAPHVDYQKAVGVIPSNRCSFDLTGKLD